MLREWLDILRDNITVIAILSLTASLILSSVFMCIGVIRQFGISASLEVREFYYYLGTSIVGLILLICIVNWLLLM